jgi:hypothetical protein
MKLLRALFSIFLIQKSKALQPQPTNTSPIARKDGINEAMSRRYDSNQQPTIILQPCGTEGSLQDFIIDANTRDLTLADGRCLVRDSSAKGGLTAGVCDETDVTKWSAPSCNVGGCLADSYWVKALKDGDVAGCPGSQGPAIEMWTLDVPQGICHNELFSIVNNSDGKSVTIRSLNDNTPSGCPSGQDVKGWCLSVVPPPPPPPPCTLRPRVRCHVGVWNNAPTRTPSSGVVDGPILGNGDLGSALSASGVSGGLTHWIGKSDMWATNTNVDSTDPNLHSDTFYTAISGGRLSIDPTTTSLLSSSSSSLSSRKDVSSANSFFAEQVLETATVVANTSAISTSSFIASDENTLIIKISTNMSSIFNLSVGVDTSYNLPLNGGVSSMNNINMLWASKGGVSATDNSMILMPCDTRTYVIWPSVNTFSVDESTGIVKVSNGTSDVCPHRVTPTKVSIGECDDNDGKWSLIQVPGKASGIMQLSLLSNSTLCAWAMGPEYHNSGGIVSIGECSSQTSGFWTFINGQIQYNSTQCLTAIPANVNITLGLATLVVRVSDGQALQFISPELKESESSVTSTAGVSLEAGVDYWVILAASTTRDTNWLIDPVDASLDLASKFVGDINYPSTKLSIHTNSWSSFWNVSEVILDDSRTLLEGFWYGAQYLLGSTTRLGSIPPGLWGVWALLDAIGWNGDYTIDYNAQANYYGACSSNRCEIVRPLLDTIASDWHLEVSRQRAGANWLAKGSAGGPGQTSQSMCCGYMDQAYENPHICPSTSPGNYSGIEMTTHIGPFAGLIYFSDLSLRVVAPMVAMTFIEYVDYLDDLEYLQSTAYNLVDSIGDFLLSYVTFDSSDGYYHILNACAQEICGGGPESEDDPHHDIAFARTVLSALLRWSVLLDRDVEKRPLWTNLRASLPPYPLGVNSLGDVVWLEARNTQQYFGSNANGYPIVYTAALHPANDISLSSDPDDVAIGCNTVFTVANSSEWHPLNGLCMAWPPATRCAGTFLAKKVLDGWEGALTATMNNNFYPDLGGGGIEQAGATEAINSALVQSQEGFIRLFPMMPIDETASFKSLRARGAFLISASWVNGTVLSPWSIQAVSTRNVNCSFLSPWDSTIVPRVIDSITNATIAVSQDSSAPIVNVWVFLGQSGKQYSIYSS